jgi:transcriptional regulator GlxA family with amidase domain
MKPSEHQQRLRITRAREMLEFSRASVDEIAARIGYEDVAASAGSSARSWASRPPTTAAGSAPAWRAPQRQDPRSFARR